MSARKILLSMAVAMLSIGICQAQDSYELERARRMINAGDYTKAAMTLRPLADGGNAEAQYLASKLFAKGWGVVKSQSQCLKYLQLSADQGYAVAVNQMIILYKDQDPAKAVRIAEKYCDRFENLKDQYPGAYLAEACLTGNGTKKDIAKAMDLAIDAKDETFTQKLKDNIYDTYVRESGKKYNTEPNDFALLDSIFKENGKFGDKIAEIIIDNTPDALERLKSENTAISHAMLAYCYYKGKGGAMQNKKFANRNAYKAMNAGSDMGKFYWEKYREKMMPGAHTKENVFFEMRDEDTWEKMYNKQAVLCTWQEVGATLKKMGFCYRLPSREEAKLLMKYWMDEETNSKKTMNIWTSSLPGTGVYYWQTYNFKGELVKEEPYHGFYGSAYRGKCWVIGVAQHK